MSNILIGCIADDFTGATDLANNFVRHGLKTILTIGVPPPGFDPLGTQVIVIALKIRTIEPAIAVREALDALQGLQSLGAKQIYFKYCSTFDSTPQGNIGPITDALMAAMGTDFTVACPAFPGAGRTIYQGHLFVNQQLLSDSGMRHHPLTPMTNSNLVQVLQEQTPQKVGLVDYLVTRLGEQAISEQILKLKKEGVKIAILDCVDNLDLIAYGQALHHMPLVTAGSGIAIGLAQSLVKQLKIGGEPASKLPSPAGHAAVISGSCSIATNQQVKHFLSLGLPVYEVNPIALAQGEVSLADIISWAKHHIGEKPILIYATATPDQVKKNQAALGTKEVSELIEQTLALTAKALVENGVRQLIVAGGETSGAVVQELGLTYMQIGQQISPGVPWTYAANDQNQFHLALKSGNFGEEDFFSQAFSLLNW
jgi:3-dehydrotetronate 4-kinase